MHFRFCCSVILGIFKVVSNRPEEFVPSLSMNSEVLKNNKQKEVFMSSGFKEVQFVFP